MSQSLSLSSVLLSGVALIAVVNISLTHEPTNFIDQPKANVRSMAVAKIIIIPEPNSLKELSQITQDPVANQFVANLNSDEFQNRLVFDYLSSYEPLAHILKKGVLSYERKTLRTPGYNNEEGYDLISYEIKHPLGGLSRIVAYLSKPANDGGERQKRIVILSGQSGEINAELIQFEAESLTQQNQISWAKGHAMLDSELAEASTLMRASVQ
jgi:hypothetical protein